MMKKYVLILFMLFAVQLFAQDQKYGSINGRAVDKETQMPLIGVNVFVKESYIGASTDENGYYEIDKVPVGTYTITFSYIGYNPTTKTDIIVKSNLSQTVNVELLGSVIEMESVVVNGGYFADVESKPVSAVNYSAEEIRRAPGSAGDVSRILFGLPSLAKVNDQMNSLIVRGGSPIENIFYLDNIEIQNINHFPVQGSSDGPISLINSDFVKDVEFFSGGFSPIYGDRLSSVMNIKFREGNQKDLAGKLDLSMQGFRGTFESPISDKGSFMISANRSYLDLVVKSVNESGPVPEYGDVQGKFTYNFSDQHKLTLFGLWSNDYVEYNYDNALEDNAYNYGITDITKSTLGANWRIIWNNGGYTNTSFSYNYSDNDNKYNAVSDKNDLMDNKSKEKIFSIRNTTYYKLSKLFKMEFGAEAKFGVQNYDIHYYEYTDRIGNTVPDQYIKTDLNTFKGGVFGVVHWNPAEKLTVSPGVRADYFDYTSETVISPRLSMIYKLTDNTSINASVGRFYQNIPNLILAQSDDFKKLKTPYADHFVLGVSHLITESTRLSVEVYDKEYRNATIDLTKPEFLVFDQGVEQGIILNHSSLTDNGKAYSRGVEVILHKKLAEDLYGMISGSYSKNRYADYFGTWRDRRYDNQIMFTLEGGYKLNNEWEFSGRWIYAGGAPYTPFDIAASSLNGRGIDDVNRVNEERLQDYHSLNIRVDKRFYFSGTNLIVYLSVWNVYGRENVTSYNWDTVNNKSVPQHGWGTLPVFGIEFDF